MRNRRAAQAQDKPRIEELPVVAVSASSDHAWPASWIASPLNVLDQDPAYIWNSYAMAPGWIRLDLGQPRTVRRLELLPSMAPYSGLAEHRIRLGTTEGKLRTASVLYRECRDREWIVHTLEQGIDNKARFVEILTTTSPSWVAWVRIRILGDP
jgi:hypothetical protein